MEQYTPLILKDQSIALTYPDGRFACVVMDVRMREGEPREGYVLVGGLVGHVVQSYPVVGPDYPSWFLCQWLGLPD